MEQTAKAIAWVSLKPSAVGETLTGINRVQMEFPLWHRDWDDLIDYHILAQGLHGLQETHSLLGGDGTLVVVELEDRNSILWCYGFVIGTRIEELVYESW